MFDSDDAKEKFNNFLFLMDEQLDAVESEAKERGIPLTADMDSLENLEKLFFQITEDCSVEEKQGWSDIRTICRGNCSGNFRRKLASFS